MILIRGPMIRNMRSWTFKSNRGIEGRRVEGISRYWTFRTLCASILIRGEVSGYQLGKRKCIPELIRAHHRLSSCGKVSNINYNYIWQAASKLFSMGEFSKYINCVCLLQFASFLKQSFAFCYSADTSRLLQSFVMWSLVVCSVWM